MATYVVRRDTDEGREYFCGLDRNQILTSRLIFGAWEAESREDGNAAIAMLAENDLPGFYLSEIIAAGVSEGLTLRES